MYMVAIIGITANILRDKDGMFPGYERCYINQDYVYSVTKHAGVPVVLPIHSDKNAIVKQVEQLDGLILSGGYDVSPHLYGEDPRNLIGETLLKRDLFEYTVLEQAKKRGIPILGICRGAQLINVYHGGTLYQDVSYRERETLRHWQGVNPTEKTHRIQILEQCHLARVFEEREIFVNSFHHQLIKDIAPDFKGTARSSDGVIECIEAQNYPYLVGVQWHPEMLWREEAMDKLFIDFIKNAKESG